MKEENGKSIEMIEQKNNLSGRSSLCTRGLAVAWKNLKVTARIEKSHIFSSSEYTNKGILHEVSGAIEAETLVAIIGPSGSGKSTLMSVIANRNPAGLQVNGKITIGGKPKGDFMKYVSGFVYQDDLFIPSFTVMEHLIFTAKLRLGSSVSPQSLMTLVEDVINLLGLQKLTHTRIGCGTLEAGKISLSGGECKRLSIATELITDPGLLFCDEPTTGLDSFTAYNVISYLKSLTVLRQKTIVCSIHQPSAQIFGQFNHIILMCQGKIAYCGPSKDAVEFFKEQGYLIHDDTNVANYLLENLVKESSYDNGIVKLCQDFAKSRYSNKALQLIKQEINKNVYHDSVIFYKSLSSPSWIAKLLYHTQRNSLSLTRALGGQVLSIVFKFALTLILGLCLHGTVTWTQAGLTSLKGVISLSIYQNFLPGTRGVMNYIPSHMSLFHREYSNNVTTPLLFYLSQVFCLIPGAILDPFIYTLIILYLTNLMRNISTVVLCCFANILLVITSRAFSILVSVYANDFNSANSILSPIEVILVTCCGTFLKLSSMPWFLVWIPKISWVTYTIEIMFIVLVDGITNIACDSTSDAPCLKTGDDVLESYGFNASNLWPNFIKIGSIFFVIHFTAYIFLLRKLKHRTA